MGQWRPLFEPDEGRYVAVAVEMLESGDWFTPRLSNDLPHLSKPPLTYWFIASSMAILGRSEMAIRLPWILGFLSTAGIVFLLARSIVPGRERLSALIYATMLLPWAASRIVTPDTLLTLFESLAMLGFVMWRSARGSRGGLWLLWTGLALAMMTKGPPGLVPLLPIVVFLAIRDRRALLRLFSPLPVVLFLTIGFGWYVAQAAARPDVIDYWLGTELAGRLTTSSHERHGGFLGAFTVYLPTILLGTLPWILLPIFRRHRRSVSGLEQESRLFISLWLLIPLGVFFFAQSRLPLYLLPLAVPAALMFAGTIDVARLRSRSLAIAGALWILLLVVLGSVVGDKRPDRNGRALAQAIESAVGDVPEEIVFVNENPAWSLRLYLSRPLQRVNLHGYEDWGDLGYRPLSRSVGTLMEERPPVERLYLLPHHHYVAFRNEMRENGREVVRRGHFERLVFFTDTPAE